MLHLFARLSCATYGQYTERSGSLQPLKNEPNIEGCTGYDTAERDEWLTLREMQNLLKIGRTKSWELVANGEIEAIRIGRAVRVSRRGIEQFLKRNPYAARRVER